jgi:hypothetical protein
MYLSNTEPGVEVGIANRTGKREDRFEDGCFWNLVQFFDITPEAIGQLDFHERWRDCRFFFTLLEMLLRNSTAFSALSKVRLDPSPRSTAS